MAPLSFLASRAIAHPTDNPIEKLCSALNFFWLERKKGRFRMVKRSWLLPLLEAACPSVSPDLLLALRRRASSPCSRCHSFNICRWPGGGFVLLVALRPNFCLCNFSHKPCERSGSWARRKRQGYFLVWEDWRFQWACSSYLHRMPVPRQTINTRGLLDFEFLLPNRSSKYRQTGPRKSAKKLSDFWKSLHVQSGVAAQWNFWEAGFGFLCQATS